MPSQQGKGINCFALLARDNRAVIETTAQTMDEPVRFRAVRALLSGLEETDGHRVRQCGSPSGAPEQRTTWSVATARSVSVLLAALLATSEDCRKAVGQTQI